LNDTRTPHRWVRSIGDYDRHAAYAVVAFVTSG
jgi:hypothetical protein